jgi:hypothetical protein
MTPKPVYHELKKLIKGKWWTKTTLQTGPDGTAALRGFFGNYKVTATREGKEPVVEEFVLVRREKNRWVVKVE